MSNPNPPGIPAADQIAQVINQVQTEPKPGAVPLEIDLGTGEIFRGDTPQDLLNKLASSKAEATRTIRTREQENAELRQQIAALQQQAPAKPEIDHARANEYFQTWSSNPTKATEIALAESLGVPADRVIPMLKTAIEGQAVSTASSEFLNRCPDFPETPQNALLVRNALVQRYGANPQALSADNLELVYHDLVRNGKITPNPLQTAGFAQPNGSPVPNIRGGSAPSDPVNDIMSQAQSMPIEDLKKVIDRLYAQTAR